MLYLVKGSMRNNAFAYLREEREEFENNDHWNKKQKKLAKKMKKTLHHMYEKRYR